PRSFVPQSEKKLEERNMNGGGSGSGGGGSGAVKTPTDFLKSIRGRPVVVKLNSGVDYRGILACLDAYMNIAMEQTEEYVNGQLKKNVR
ncbi:U6 snRNA-associated Sm-like protein, partial [Musa troglodytarum]